MALTSREIRAGLRGLGVEEGDALVVHSSLSSLGHVEGGADAVVDALLDAVGPSGTLAVPTFTRYDDPYDAEESPSTTGAVTNAVRTREAAERSAHPTKSVAVIGPDATEIVADHEPANSLGIDSPLHRVLQRDGRILLIGVDHTTNSALHVAERLAGMAYRDQKAETTTSVGDSVERVTVNQVHCSKGFEAISPLARHAAIARIGRIGDAEARLIEGEPLLNLAVELLETAPGALLCSSPNCDRCGYARERIAASRD